MSKPSFRQIQPLDVPDEALQNVNDKLGVPTMVRPGKAMREAPAPKPSEKLTVMLPTYVADAVRQQALTKRMTVRNFILMAIKSQGITVEEADLFHDGRRTRPKTRTA